MPYLNNEQIINLINKKKIYSLKSINKKQVQPASLDLTLSNKCYRIKASFIPNNIKIYVSLIEKYYKKRIITY